MGREYVRGMLDLRMLSEGMFDVAKCEICSSIAMEMVSNQMRHW